MVETIMVIRRKDSEEVVDEEEFIAEVNARRRQLDCSRIVLHDGSLDQALSLCMEMRPISGTDDWYWLVSIDELEGNQVAPWTFQTGEEVEMLQCALEQYPQLSHALIRLA